MGKNIFILLAALLMSGVVQAISFIDAESKFNSAQDLQLNDLPEFKQKTVPVRCVNSGDNSVGQRLVQVSISKDPVLGLMARLNEWPPALKPAVLGDSEETGKTILKDLNGGSIFKRLKTEDPNQFTVISKVAGTCHAVYDNDDHLIAFKCDRYICWFSLRGEN